MLKEVTKLAETTSGASPASQASEPANVVFRFVQGGRELDSELVVIEWPLYAATLAACERENNAGRITSLEVFLRDAIREKLARLNSPQSKLGEALFKLDGCSTRVAALLQLLTDSLVHTLEETGPGSHDDSVAAGVAMMSLNTGRELLAVVTEVFNAQRAERGPA